MGYVLKMAVAAVVLITAMLTYAPVVSAEGPGTGLKTCSGQEAAFFAENYFFGLQRYDGFCMVKTLYANSESEAWDCARHLCEDCTVEDLSGLLKFRSSDPAVNDMRNYCPAR